MRPAGRLASGQDAPKIRSKSGDCLMAYNRGNTQGICKHEITRLIPIAPKKEIECWMSIVPNIVERSRTKNYSPHVGSGRRRL